MHKRHYRIIVFLINIPFIAIKGGALAHSVYKDAAHRPMEDLDLLVSDELCDAAQNLLKILGFVAPRRINDSRHQIYSHQLTIAYKILDGVIVNVEIHRTPLSFIMGSNLDASSRSEPYININKFRTTVYGLSAAQSIILSYQNIRKL
ncbi:MAG: nucleotidyltransferase family protein, partial [Paludibacter sp.]